MEHVGEGRKLRDSGQALALDNEGETWLESFYRLLGQRPLEEPFLAENFRALASRILGEPHTFRVWGAAWSGAVKKGLVEKTGEWVHCSAPANHACTAPLYRWAASR